MGLDMYARTTRKEITGTVDFEVDGDHSRELFYWRKHPNLHGWMERLYRSRGGQAEMFNLVNVLITREDLNHLEQAVTAGNLPSNDFEFIRLAREALDQGFQVYYTSWW